ncbi:MBL fold metallo-hydrolase [Kaarinaea lacus]
MQNYNDAVSVTRDIYWVGFYDNEANLHCNPYLLIDEQEVVFFDPGSIPHFPIIMRKVIDLVNPSEITTIIASHQDPDVCGNLPVLEDVVNHAGLKIVAHGNTLRLIRHYGLQSSLFAVEDYDYELALQSGRRLQFLPTPYLHSPGAMVTYDENTGSLFTSDLFGAISNNWSLFAKGEYLEPMKIWHQKYMPSNRILADCMRRLEKLPLQRILPQHGSILEGAQVQQAIDYLKELPVGLDLMTG